jgi:hypothetical protein
VSFIVQVLCPPSDVNALTLRIVQATQSSSQSPVLSQRMVPMQKASEMIAALLPKFNTSAAMQIVMTFARDKEKKLDVHRTRAAILQVFNEKNVTGQLTSDEFMMRLGNFDQKFSDVLSKLSNADIGVLTSEADTDDGVISYDEFIPYAADLILTVRAREQGKRLSDAQNKVLDADVTAIMKAQNLQNISDACLQKFKTIDSSATG